MSQHNISRMPYEDLKINITPTQHSPMMQVQKIPEDKSTLNTLAGVEENQASVFIMAGAAAGIMEHCIMYPVDSVKKNLAKLAIQPKYAAFTGMALHILVGRNYGGKSPTRMQSLRPHPQAVYRNVKDAFTKIISTEGITRPMRGVNVVALGAGPAHAMYFGSYEIMKKFLGNNGNGGHFPVANALSGAIATVFHDGTMNPAEVIKQRIQMYNSPYRGAFDCVRCVMKTEGIGAFYRSFTTQLTMNIPFQCLHFVTYEFMREMLNPSGGYSPATHLIAGATAGGVASAITNPLDVAKTLLNTQESNAVSALIKTRSSQELFVKGMFNALKTIYTLRGVSGYFQGVQARIIYQMPSCAISWSVYEFFKHYLSLKISEEEMMELTA